MTGFGVGDLKRRAINISQPISQSVSLWVQTEVKKSASFLVQWSAVCAIKVLETFDQKWIWKSQLPKLWYCVIAATLISYDIINEEENKQTLNSRHSVVKHFSITTLHFLRRRWSLGPLWRWRLTIWKHERGNEKRAEIWSFSRNSVKI